jgi:eukaryotic-like serine/threonine-protein kinase
VAASYRAASRYAATVQPLDTGGLAGTVHGRFRFERLIGSGGLGEVYEATDTTTGERYAVKTVLPGARTLETTRRLVREGIAGSLLDHPNIVDVLAIDHLADGTPYIVMELVAGTSVGSLLRQGGVTPTRAFAIVRQTLDGLAHAHAHGVLHRDLKPENLMMTPAEIVKILDLGLAKLIADELGLAKLTETGTVFGTPTYMAPEQALGRTCTPATDLYAVGVMLYEMLAGRPPFVGGDIHAILRLHVSGPIPKLSAPWCTRELAHVIEQALQKAPDARFASAADMRAAVWDAEQSLRS